jgi:hypothetical protein
MEFEVTVDREPARAGIDPYNKLIDRKPDDNVVAVERNSLKPRKPSQRP